jgi:hypothetical protein
MKSPPGADSGAPGAKPSRGEGTDESLVSGGSWGQHCRCTDAFTERGMRQRKSEGFSDGRVIQEDFLDFTQRDLLSAAIDDFLDPSPQNK